MRRREFILALGGAAAWPLAVRAQGERRRRIGVLMGWPESDHKAQSWVAALRDDWRPDASRRAGRGPDWRESLAGERPYRHA